MQYGYGRVSTNMQDTALQEDAFKRARVRKVTSEKWSSVGCRPQLQELLARLKPGDELVVYKLDRLGRSLQDLLGILDRISSAGAAFRSLTEPIDTRTSAGKLMYSVLGAVAEFERSMIKERAIAGQVAAWERGVRWGGQPRALNTEDVLELFRLRDLGYFTIPVLAEMFGCSVATVDRALARRRYPAKFAAQRTPVLRRYLTPTNVT
jgi:DNA invertase Pin-like site-specific DNA recombinase